jgi:hypothetical protein
LFAVFYLMQRPPVSDEFPLELNGCPEDVHIFGFPIEGQNRFFGNEASRVANEEEVVAALFDGTQKSFEVVSLPNLNVAVMLLKELGREKEASDLLRFFVENRNDHGYWTLDDPFERGPFDPDVNAIIEEKTSQEPQEFDPAAALIEAGKSYDPETIKRLAAVPVETYRDLIVGSRGEQLRSIVLSALEFRRIANASDDMRRVKELMEEALRMVARHSLLNELRIKKYGVSV